ncbi:hypothetical protein [Mycolicibacterium murale]|uniref:hypothetical protein n=1 Tax=Mycolicibacterium murale TaxID=182220 RepID=UPI0018752D0A|nr:hypothetical protein [Mycolicibacterium murale]MCV7185098.1 hypothetical protein [Mycolicibacterium murale]
MAPPPTPDPEDRGAWYRSTTAVSVAGVVGAALVAGLAVTVVKMSDQWTSPTPTVMTTSVPTTQQTLRTTEPFIATPTYSSTSFPTSVRLSTTDIGVPGESSTTTDSSATSTTDSPTSRSTRRPGGQDDDETTTTTRKRPRLNETRTLSP